MDLSKLNSNERLAFWGAILSIVGTILTIVGAYIGAGGLWLTFILAIAMIVILFLPTWSPQTTLPGSKGTLMLVVGGIAAIGAILGLLSLLSVIRFLGSEPIFVIGLLAGIAGGLMMGWGGWQEFQAEGGKFQLGTSPAATDSSATPSDAAAASVTAESADTSDRARVAGPTTPVDTPTDQPPVDRRDEDRPRV
ncbi:MAG: hypothetical protein ACT4OQ_11145 [Chloroflexota bacterium]